MKLALVQIDFTIPTILQGHMSDDDVVRFEVVVHVAHPMHELEAAYDLDTNLDDALKAEHLVNVIYLVERVTELIHHDAVLFDFHLLVDSFTVHRQLPSAELVNCLFIIED